MSINCPRGSRVCGILPAPCQLIAAGCPPLVLCLTLVPIQVCCICKVIGIVLALSRLLIFACRQVKAFQNCIDLGGDWTLEHKPLCTYRRHDASWLEPRDIAANLYHVISKSSLVLPACYMLSTCTLSHATAGGRTAYMHAKGASKLNTIRCMFTHGVPTTLG